MKASSTIAVLLLFALLRIPASAAARAVDGAQPQAIQITDSAQYERDASVFQAQDGKYWLFWALGRDSRQVRGADGYDPDGDYYDIYYKSAASLAGLASASGTKIPLTPPDNAQRDIAALQTSDGTIWVFTSTGLAWGTQREIYYYTYDGDWEGPAAVPGTDYAAHISALDYDGKIWVFFDYGYTLKVVVYDESLKTWSDATTIAGHATLAKAMAAGDKIYVVWAYVDEIAGIWGSGIYLSTWTAQAGWTTSEGPIAAWPAEGATNWDPVLTKDGPVFRLYWAPDIGDGGQFLATSISAAPEAAASWSAPTSLTASISGMNSWWDFWPVPFHSNGARCLFFTSERNADQTGRTDGNIWLIVFPAELYLPVVGS